MNVIIAKIINCDYKTQTCHNPEEKFMPLYTTWGKETELS